MAEQMSPTNEGPDQAGPLRQTPEQPSTGPGFDFATYFKPEFNEIDGSVRDEQPLVQAVTQTMDELFNRLKGHDTSLHDIVKGSIRKQLMLSPTDPEFIRRDLITESLKQVINGHRPADINALHLIARACDARKDNVALIVADFAQTDGAWWEIAESEFGEMADLMGFPRSSLSKEKRMRAKKIVDKSRAEGNGTSNPFDVWMAPETEQLHPVEIDFYNSKDLLSSTIYKAAIILLRSDPTFKEKIDSLGYIDWGWTQRLGHRSRGLGDFPKTLVFNLSDAQPINDFWDKDLVEQTHSKNTTVNFYEKDKLTSVTMPFSSIVRQLADHVQTWITNPEPKPDTNYEPEELKDDINALRVLADQLDTNKMNIRLIMHPHSNVLQKPFIANTVLEQSQEA